jgi:hypothetical protein
MRNFFATFTISVKTCKALSYYYQTIIRKPLPPKLTDLLYLLKEPKGWKIPWMAKIALILAK